MWLEQWLYGHRRGLAQGSQAAWLECWLSTRSRGAERARSGAVTARHPRLRLAFAARRAPVGLVERKSGAPSRALLGNSRFGLDTGSCASWRDAEGAPSVSLTARRPSQSLCARADGSDQSMKRALEGLRASTPPAPLGVPTSHAAKRRGAVDRTQRMHGPKSARSGLAKRKRGVRKGVRRGAMSTQPRARLGLDTSFAAHAGVRKGCGRGAEGSIAPTAVTNLRCDPSAPFRVPG